MGHNLAQLGTASLDTMGGLITLADARDIPEGASPRAIDVDFIVGSVFTRPGLESIYAYATTLEITGYSLLSAGVATFTYVGAEPTVNEGFLLSAFIGIFSVLNGQTVYVETVTSTTFTAFVTNGPVITASNLSGIAISTTGLFVGPNVGIGSSTSWSNPTNISSSTSYASVSSGQTYSDTGVPTSGSNQSLTNGWSNPNNVGLTGASVASVLLSIGGGSSGISLLQSILGGNGIGTTTATSSSKGFSKTTTAGSLLVCVVWSTGAISTLALPPTINTPSTSGFTWQLAAGKAPLASFADTNYGLCGSVAIYYIANAGSMSTSTLTQVSVSDTYTSSIAVEFALYEFSGVQTVSPIDSTGTGKENTTQSVPSTTNLSTTQTDLVFVAMVSNDEFPGTQCNAGTNYTLGISSTVATLGQSQYILNQPAGSVATAFSGNQYSWGCAAVAFT